MVVGAEEAGSVAVQVREVILGVQPAGDAGVVRVGKLLFGREEGLNGVGLTHALEGVLVHRAYALAVHQHVGNLIPGIGGDAEGLVAAAAHPHPAVRADPAAMARAGLNGVPGRAGAAAGAGILCILRRKGHVPGDRQIQHFITGAGYTIRSQPAGKAVSAVRSNARYRITALTHRGPVFYCKVGSPLQRTMLTSLEENCMALYLSYLHLECIAPAHGCLRVGVRTEINKIVMGLVEKLRGTSVFHQVTIDFDHVVVSIGPGVLLAVDRNDRIFRLDTI